MKLNEATYLMTAYEKDKARGQRRWTETLKSEEKGTAGELVRESGEARLKTDGRKFWERQEG